jgi:hypothetical protein
MKAVYCDACSKLIDVENDGGLGTFNFFERKVPIVDISKPNILKKEFDLCLECSKKLENTLINIQNEAREKYIDGNEENNK